MIAWPDRLAAEVKTRRARITNRPFLIALAGAVASGKSTGAKALAGRLRKDGLGVEIVATDGFLMANAVLNARGLMDRKGFPESYDWARLTAFLSALRAGARDLSVPTYSHDTYDVAAPRSFQRPDVVILEGLIALHHQVGSVDLGLYLEADEDDLVTWYVDRFLALERWASPRLAERLDAVGGDPEALAGDIWERINAPNLHDHIAPTRARADLILRKDSRHQIRVLANEPGTGSGT